MSEESVACCLFFKYFVNGFEMEKIYILLLLITLSACGTTVKIKNANSIKVKKDSNIAFFGYDFYITDSRIKSINFRCLNLDSQKEFNCFNISTIQGGFYYNGASPYRVKFGNYKVTDIVYTIVTAITSRETCEVKDGKKSKCNTIESEVTKQKKIKVGFDKTFTVSETEAPYIGRFVLFARDNKKNNPELRSAEVVEKFDEDLLNVKNEKLRVSIKNHIDR